MMMTYFTNSDNTIFPDLYTIVSEARKQHYSLPYQQYINTTLPYWCVQEITDLKSYLIIELDKKFGIYNCNTNVFMWTPFLCIGRDTDGYLICLLKLNKNMLGIKEMTYNSVLKSTFCKNMLNIINNDYVHIEYYKRDEIEAFVSECSWYNYDDNYKRDNKANYIALRTDIRHQYDQLISDISVWIKTYYPELIVPVPYKKILKYGN